MFVTIIIIILGSLLFFFAFIFPRKAEDKMPNFSKRITVDLSKCELYPTTFYEEGEETLSIFNPIGNMFDPDTYKNTGRRDSNERVYIKYVDNNIRYISTPIDESQESLRLKFEKKKVTYIYVDANNDRNYFFDLNFLTEK